MKKNSKSNAKHLDDKFLYLVSACLAGVNCRWDGTNARNQKIIELVGKGKALLICPEELGGLPTPRQKAEFFEGGGEDFLSGKGKVITSNGKDVTSQMVKGAKEVLRMVKKYKIECAIMKRNSPSCGCGKIYRRGRLIKGDGVTTALLRKEGIKIIPK